MFTSKQGWLDGHPLFYEKELSMNLNYLKPLLEKKINELGYSLEDLSSRKEKGEVVLSIVVDRVDPIDMNAIVLLSGEISSYLDEIDESEEKYLLDISSLGAEKPLKINELSSYVGRYIHVHVNNAIEGNNIFEGDLLEVNKDSITLSYRVKTRVKTVVILLNNIYKIRLAIKF